MSWLEIMITTVVHVILAVTVTCLSMDIVKKSEMYPGVTGMIMIVTNQLRKIRNWFMFWELLTKIAHLDMEIFPIHIEV